MNKVLIGTAFLINSLFALDVPIDEVEKHTFINKISVNSKVIQLSSAKEQVMARVGGKIINFKVKQGDFVKKGQAIASIDSLELASFVSELKTLRNQLAIVDKNYKLIKKLYNTGVESRQNLNRQEEERNVIVSKIELIKEKRSFIGGKGSRYTVYAQGSGKVTEILVSRNSVVDANTALLSIVKGEESFFLKSYISLKYLSQIKVGQKGQLRYGGKSYKMHIAQILPELDEQTQQIVALCSLDEPVNNLFVNAYVDTKLNIGKKEALLAVKKSALSFFNNEWVVFVPEHHEDEHKEHELRRGRTNVSTHAHDEKEHDEHEEDGHDEHEEEDVPYDIKVVKILKQNKQWVAIEGLDEHEDYVSDKSYYIKSLLLKSSLGGHGH